MLVIVGAVWCGFRDKEKAVRDYTTCTSFWQNVVRMTKWWFLRFYLFFDRYKFQHTLSKRYHRSYYYVNKITKLLTVGSKIFSLLHQVVVISKAAFVFRYICLPLSMLKHFLYQSRHYLADDLVQM